MRSVVAMTWKLRERFAATVAIIAANPAVSSVGEVLVDARDLEAEARR